MKQNWFVVSKMTKIWWILIRALKSLKKSFLVIFDLKKLSFMTLESDAKFEEKLTCGLENNMKNLANFHQSTWKSQNCDFDGILLSKVENLWASNLQGSYVSWQWRMMQKLNCQFKTDLRNLTNFDPSTCKSQKFAHYWTAFEQCI